MLHHLSLGVSDIARAATFYDAALAALGYHRIWSDIRPGEPDQAIGYGPPGGGDKLALKHLGDYLFYLVLDGFRLAQMLFHNALAQLLDYLRCGHAADIAHDEYLFELVIKFVVNLGLAVEHRVDGSRHILAGLFESLVYS